MRMRLMRVRGRRSGRVLRTSIATIHSPSARADHSRMRFPYITDDSVYAYRPPAGSPAPMPISAVPSSLIPTPTATILGSH